MEHCELQQQQSRNAAAGKSLVNAEKTKVVMFTQETEIGILSIPKMISTTPQFSDEVKYLVIMYWPVDQSKRSMYVRTELIKVWELSVFL